MQVLKISGDGDYAVLTLEQSEQYGKMTYKELYDLAFDAGGEIDLEILSDDEYCDGPETVTLECFFFQDCKITEEFISFLNDMKDYDFTKHTDWVVVDKGGYF
jgi:hypothetical protein